MTHAKRPYIIAIEGIDKSGKHSLTQLAASHFRGKGYSVDTSEFHRYDTPTGQIIANYLKEQNSMNPDAIELIMAADKLNQRDMILENEHDILILDRYLLSQYAYARAKHSRFGDDEFEWIFEEMPAADLTFTLHLSPEVSMARKGKHGENDRYERDRNLLSRVNHAMSPQVTAPYLYTDRLIEFREIDEDSIEDIFAAMVLYLDECMEPEVKA